MSLRHVGSSRSDPVMELLSATTGPKGPSRCSHPFSPISRENSTKHDIWLARHKNVHLHYTPTHATWLNQVEVWFSIFTGAALRRANFTSPQDVRDAIDRFVAVYNPTAHPFEWTKDVVHPKTLERCYANLHKQVLVELTNNRVERQLRTNVIMRKITLGNRSSLGASNHAVIMSIIQTGILNGIESLNISLALSVKPLTSLTELLKIRLP